MAQWQACIPLDERSAIEDTKSSVNAEYTSRASEDVAKSHASGSTDDGRSLQNIDIEDSSWVLEAEAPKIVPGDIVYVPHQSEKRLLFTKGVYLGHSASSGHTIREWNTRQQVRVSMRELVRKTSFTESERQEAELLRADQTPWQDDFWGFRTRYRAMHIELPSRAVRAFVNKVSNIASGAQDYLGVEMIATREIFSAFLQELWDRPQLYATQNLRVEDVLRVFYATAAAKSGKYDLHESGNWRTIAEKNAQILIMLLIDVTEISLEIPKQSENDILAQLREEQVRMIERSARYQSFQSPGERGGSNIGGTKSWLYRRRSY